MITRIIPIEELKRIFIENLLNKTSKITKVSDQSVVNGVAYGVAKIGQKAIKDVALIESYLFPDAAFGDHLDRIADNLGIDGRKGSSQSGTYVRVFADEGTTYLAGAHILKGGGKSFDITETFTVGANGYGYVKVRSQTNGLDTNVPSLTINSINPAPAGHLNVTNEYQATGGRDEEGDELFRIRIKKGANIGTVGTLDRITALCQRFNSDVLEVFNYGVNSQNQSILGIVTQNGVDLTINELDQLRDDIKEFLQLQHYNNATTASIGVVLQNIEYTPVDIEFRCNLVSNSQVDEVRRNIQVEISKYFDFRYWKPTQKIEWDDLLQIVKDNVGVSYVADSYFFPQSDMSVRIDNLPRVRGFKMLDLDGNLIADNSNVLNPIYYPDVNS